MKKINLIFAALLLAFISCNKEIDNNSTKTLTFKVAQSELASKATWVDGQGFNWVATADAEEFGIGTNEGLAHSSTMALSGKDATLTATVPAAATQFFVFYPYSESRNQVCNTSIADMWFDIDANQTQAIAGTMEDMNGKMVFSSTTAGTVGTDDYTAQMSAWTSLARFIVYSSAATDETVESVSLTAAAIKDGTSVPALNGQLHLTLNFGGGSGAGYIAGTLTSKVTLGTAFSLSGVTSREQSEGIYMGILPATLSGYTYAVTTSKGTYTFVSTNDKAFAAGTVNNIYLDLEKATTKPGASSGGTDVLTFSYQNNGPFALAKDGSSIAYTGAIVSLVLNGVDITDAAKANSAAWDLAYDSWLTPSYENTTNFQVKVMASKNMTADARQGKIYIVYDGVQSENYITVNQDPGPCNEVVPTLTKLYTTNISKDGETIAQAATLSLTVNGSPSTDVAADVATYGVTLTCGAATATVTDAAGHVQIVFPANSTTDEKEYTLKAKFESNESTVTFTQAAGTGGGSSSPVYSYTFNNIIGWTDGTILSYGAPWDPNGNFWNLKNVQIDGVDIDYSGDTVITAVLEYVFQITDPGSDPAGYESRTWSPGAFGVHKVFANAIDGIAVSPIVNTANCKSRFAWRAGDGTELGYVYMMSNP